MSLARLASIHRYPIKGFGAQQLPEADLRLRQGIPFDRCLAIANGERATSGEGQWTPCQALCPLDQELRPARLRTEV